MNQISNGANETSLSESVWEARMINNNMTLLIDDQEIDN